MFTHWNPPNVVKVWCPWCRRVYHLTPWGARRWYVRETDPEGTLPHVLCDDHEAAAKTAIRRRRYFSDEIKAHEDYFRKKYGPADD